MKNKLLFTAILFVIATNTFSQVPNYVPTNGLVGWWPFNGNAIDESINTNDGTVNGATLTADRFGNANNAYSFDGVSNYISIPNSVSLSNMTSITISAWFNINQYFTQINQGWFSILSKTNSSLLGKYRLGAYTNVSGQPGFFSNLGTMEANINQNNLYSLNQWNQIIITISNGNYTIYVNGIQIFNGATTLTSSTTDNVPLLIGKDTYGLVDYAN